MARLDADADAAARREIPDDDRAPRSHGGDHVGQDPVGDRFGEDGLLR